MRTVYLDNASTTYTNHEVLAEMLPYFTTVYGNTSSLHALGREADEAINKAREQVASAINCKPSEVYFTSGATESNNWIINGVLEKSKVKRIVVSKIEHPSIIELAKKLEGQGVQVVWLNVNQDGLVNMSELLRAISRPTALVSIMAANNEMGTIQYLQAIAKVCGDKGIYFHTDATQAIGAINIDVKEMEISALSLSGHKIYGPKGVGVLYIKKGVPCGKYLLGGHQEAGMRAGTTNVPAIVGMGKAIEIAMRDMSMNNNRLKVLREYFIAEVFDKIEAVKLNGHRVQRLPNNINLSFQGIEGEGILTLLDFEGICVSTGSACSSGSLEPSYVLEAMGLEVELAHSSIRFTLGRSTSKEDLDYTVKHLVAAVKRLRSMSPMRISKNKTEEEE